MAIAYVGGTTASTGTGTATTLTIPYSSTTGNALYLAFLAFSGTTNITLANSSTPITDSASNAWTVTGGVNNGATANNTVTNCGSMFMAFTTSNTPTGITTVTIHATTATNICAVLGEYSGVTTTQYTGGTASQSTTTITGSGTTFTSSMVGGTIFYTTGAQAGFSAPITAFVSATQLTTNVSQTVASGSFVIFYPSTVAAASPVTTGAQTVVSSANWLPAALCCQTSSALPVFTSNTGTLRNQATMTLPAGYGFAGVALVDNTGATSLTDAANFTGTYLTALAVGQKTT
jgi:hypothetical protein